MKRNLLLTLIFSSFALLSFGQSFEIRTSEGAEGYLYVQMRETSGTGTPQTSNSVTDIVFQIKWLQSLGNVDMGSVICTNYEIVKSGTRASNGAYYYQEYFADNTPYAFPENWVQNTWLTIAKMEVGIGAGTGTFEIGDDAFVPTGVNIGVDLVDYTPTVNGSATGYNFPTIVYDHVWAGGNTSVPLYNEKSWALNTNWQTACGNVAAAAPTSASNCLIPGGLTYYPGNVDLFGFFIAAGNNIRITSGGEINAGELASGGLANQLLTFSGNLEVYGVLNIKSDGSITVLGTTYLDSPECLVVESTSSGVGSFIDNGTITYGASGSAKVQTYLTGSGSYGTFDFHCVGPTVDITGTGVTLAAFNVVPGETFAYKYNEPTNTWDNYSALADAIPTAKGIGLSTRDGSTNTLEMTGELKTGPVSSEAMTITTDGNYLLSNPYPSSIFWNDLYSSNIARVNDKVYIYDASFSGGDYGNYRAYNQGSGGTDDFTGYIQVGQGFFVEAVSASPFTFNNGDRYHSNASFYKSGSYTNRLDVRVSGNESRDGLLIHFYDGAVSGYEPNEDVEKKMSYSPTATQFWTVVEENLKMSINALPLELLGKGMQSVPVSFICSASGEYVMEFLDIESFDFGTEIWLEDKLIGGDWISINNQPEYIFTGSPNDAIDRFVLHFFGPTGTEEIAKPTVDVYSSGQYAYVRNNTEDAIREIRIYSLSGALMNHIKTPDQKFIKLWVADEMAYYVITVITDQQVYTKKLFISK